MHPSKQLLESISWKDLAGLLDKRLPYWRSKIFWFVYERVNYIKKCEDKVRREHKTLQLMMLNCTRDSSTKLTAFGFSLNAQDLGELRHLTNQCLLFLTTWSRAGTSTIKARGRRRVRKQTGDI